jgi:hypothetical protein
MRQASLSDNFPYRDPTVCFLEVDRSGQVTSPPDKDVSARVRSGQSQLYGCEIHDLRTFAAHMRDQRGWDVAVTGGLGSQRTPGSQPTYHVRVRRKSLA